MESYEYKIERHEDPIVDTEYLDKLTKEGWHLIGVLTEEYTHYSGIIDMPGHKRYKYIYYFVRKNAVQASAAT